MNINEKCLKFRIENQIAILTINRPDKLNGLNLNLLEQMEEFLTNFLQEISFDQIRGFILTGAGEKAFIAGADIKEMSEMNREQAQAFSSLGQRVTTLLEQVPVATIAAVNGYALGGGLEMALSCDFIFCSENAVFGLPEVTLGLIPGFGGTQRLQKCVGTQVAKDIIFSGRKVRPEEAHARSIVSKIFSDQALLISGCIDYLSKLIKNSPTSIAMAKQAMSDGETLNIEEALKIEAHHFADLFEYPEMIEGTTAFMQKRKADYADSAKLNKK